jgi:hypothetical protein
MEQSTTSVVIVLLHTALFNFNFKILWKLSLKIVFFTCINYYKMEQILENLFTIFTRFREVSSS